MLLTRLSCILAFGGLIAVAQQQEPANIVFHSDVSLVRVDAQVLDRDNRAVTGLRAEDFVLRHDGQIVPIRNFASEEMPVDILLLLDVSGSMRVHVQRIADAAHQAMRVLAPDDRIGIMVFDTYSRMRMPFRTNRDDVYRELDRLLREERFNGGTDIKRAILSAADYVRQEGRRDARRAIVILTDDQTGFESNDYTVDRALQRADAVLSLLLAPDALAGYGRHGGGHGYPGGGGNGGSTWPGGGVGGGPLGGIIFGRRGGYGGHRGGYGYPGGQTHPAGTAETARTSGGDTIAVDDAYALQNTLQRLRQRYALYFHMPEGARAGDERSVEVDLADSTRHRFREAEVRYRRIYLAPGGSTDSSPVMITRAPSSLPPERSHSTAIPDPDRPAHRRRAAVDEPEGGPRVNLPGTSTVDPQTASAPSVPPPNGAAAPARTDPPANTEPAPQPKHGWRRVTDPPPPDPTKPKQP